MSDSDQVVNQESGEATAPSLILTIRLIRSFEHRNVKNIVLKLSDRNILVKDLKALICSEIKSPTSKHNLPPPFKMFAYDTLKIEHVPFKSKSTDPVINCENDESLILSDEKSIDNLVNETEISFFLLKDYIQYKQNKNIK